MIPQTISPQSFKTSVFVVCFFSPFASFVEAIFFGQLIFLALALRFFFLRVPTHTCPWLGARITPPPTYSHARWSVK